MSIGTYSVTMAKIQARFHPAAQAPQAPAGDAYVAAPARPGLRARWRVHADATPLLPGFMQCTREIPEFFRILECHTGGQPASMPKQRARKAVVLSLFMPAAAVADAAAFVAYPARVIAHAMKKPQPSAE